MVLFARNGINRRTFNMITGGTVVIIRFRLDLYNGTIFHVSVTSVSTRTNRVLLRLYTMIVIARPNGTSQLCTMTDTMRHRVSHVATEGHFVRLQMSVSTIVTSYHRNFRLSSSNDDTQGHSDT